jgi:hypothetical protein
MILLFDTKNPYGADVGGSWGGRSAYATPAPITAASTVAASAIFNRFMVVLLCVVGSLRAYARQLRVELVEHFVDVVRV